MQPVATLQSDPTATLRLTPEAATTLLTQSDGEPFHSRDLPALAVTDSADLRPIRTLGEGGMGRVQLASQGSLDREVAVKSALRVDREAAHALILEGVITGKLEHPNIPPVHQLGRDAEGNPILVMKRIEGARWSELLADRDHPVRKDNPLFLRDEENAHLEILMQVANACHYAHSRGVFHRDIKPDNVMIGRFGEVYLIDWGVAWSESIHGRADIGTNIVGSAAYMAPELVWGEKPDARTDVYLLGATLHQVLTGRYRHAGDTASAAMRAAAKSYPYKYDDDVPAELAALCNRATSLRREDRPESALEFVQALRGYLRHRESNALTRRALDLLPKDDPVALAECRFALEEALRRWPENEDAKSARSQLFAKLIEQHLREESPNAARALIAELGDEGSAYEERIAALEAKLAARKRVEERARDESDFADGRRSREWFFGFLALMIVGRAVYRFYHPFNELTNDARLHQLFETSLLIFLPPIVAVLFGRRVFARTAAGRSVLALLAIVGGSIIVHRAIALVLRADVLYVLITDCLLLSAGFVVSALRLGKWPLWGALVGMCVIAALLIHRQHLPLIMNGGALIGMVVMIAAQRWAARRNEHRSTETAAAPSRR